MTAAEEEDMWLANLKIGPKLAVGFATVLLTAAVATMMVGFAVVALDEADTTSVSADRAFADIQAADAAHLDQAQALRGYVLSREDLEATNYDKATKEFASRMAAAKAESVNLPGASEVAALIDKMEAAGKAWQSQTGDRTLNLARNPQTYDQAMAIAKTSTADQDPNKSGFRDAENAANAKLTAISGDLQKRHDDMAYYAELALILGALGALGMALLVGLWLYNTIAEPVRQMTDVMKRLAAGDNEVEVPAKGRKDSMGLMAESVEAFRCAAIQKLRAEAEAAEAQCLIEKERALREAGNDEQQRHSETAVAIVGEGLDRLAKGDLTWRIETPLHAAADQLRVDFNTAVEKLQDAMLGIITRVRAMRSGTQEISTAADDLSRRTEQQAASLEETAAALEEITSTVRKTAEGAAHANDVVAKSKSDAGAGGEIVRRAIDAVGGIEKSSQEISQIIGVIDEIAFQTNLLALNAGVEAARAGDAGRGFAVVASEVRALAQRSAEAAKKIKALISASTTQVDAGVQLVADSGKALDRIVAQVADINQVVSEIATSAREQATGLQEVNGAVNAMDQVTQQNAAVVEQSTAATHTLARETEQLSRLLDQFKVGETRAAPAREDNEQMAKAGHKAGHTETRRPSVAPKIARSSKGSAAVARKPAVQVVAEESWEEF
jgi:methyl-accepting chemotaxis protein